MAFGQARWRQDPVTRRDRERLAGRARHWVGGSDAHWDVHDAISARNLAPGLRALGAGERNVHRFTPAAIVHAGTD